MFLNVGITDTWFTLKDYIWIPKIAHRKFVSII